MDASVPIKMDVMPEENIQQNVQSMQIFTLASVVLEEVVKPPVAKEAMPVAD